MNNFISKTFYFFWEWYLWKMGDTMYIILTLVSRKKKLFCDISINQNQNKPMDSTWKWIWLWNVILLLMYKYEINIKWLTMDRFSPKTSKLFILTQYAFWRQFVLLCTSNEFILIDVILMLCICKSVRKSSWCGRVIFDYSWWKKVPFGTKPIDPSRPIRYLSMTFLVELKYHFGACS